MGYNLSIGEARVEEDQDDGYVSARIYVDGIDGADLGAPVDSSGLEDSRGNSISPGYIVWGCFAKAAGLHDVFFGVAQSGEKRWGVDGEHLAIIHSHPGNCILTAAHLERFKAARDSYTRETPQWEYGFANGGDGYKRTERATDEGHKWNTRRLDWLVWWTEWAIANCKRPVFVNG